MIAKFLLAFLILLVQEATTLAGLIFATHRGVYPAILIHCLFLVATCIDIVSGYFVGKLLRGKFSKSRLVKWINKWAEKFLVGTSKYKRWIALFLLGNFSFPWINSCIAGYLDLPFWESAFFNFLGDIFWYASIWLIAIGVSAIFKNFYYGLIVAVVVALLVMILINFFKSKKYGKENK